MHRNRSGCSSFSVCVCVRTRRRRSNSGGARVRTSSNRDHRLPQPQPKEDRGAPTRSSFHTSYFLIASGNIRPSEWPSWPWSFTCPFQDSGHQPRTQQKTWRSDMRWSFKNDMLLHACHSTAAGSNPSALASSTSFSASSRSPFSSYSSAATVLKSVLKISVANARACVRRQITEA